MKSRIVACRGGSAQGGSVAIRQRLFVATRSAQRSASTEFTRKRSMPKSIKYVSVHQIVRDSNEMLWFVVYAYSLSHSLRPLPSPALLNHRHSSSIRPTVNRAPQKQQFPFTLRNSSGLNVCDSFIQCTSKLKSATHACSVALVARYSSSRKRNNNNL